MTKWLQLAGFLLLTVGGGFLVGSGNRPGDWYRDLDKPWFSPPDWVFAPAWTTLYVLIAIAGWRVLRAGNRKALVAWGAQMALNFLWPPVFFTAQAVLPALAVVTALFAAILVFLGRVGLRDPVAFWCFVPYALWVAYATALNGAIWRLNP